MIGRLLIAAFVTAPTYKDIKPILENRCAQCHNSNWSEKNWMDEKTAKAFSKKIKLKLEDQSMPPGNSTDMTKSERQKVVDWVNGGSR